MAENKMYFLSKNMCFLLIKTVFDEKPKKSGPTDGISGVFPLQPPQWKRHTSPACSAPRRFAAECVFPPFRVGSQCSLIRIRTNTRIRLTFSSYQVNLCLFYTTFIFQFKTKFYQHSSHLFEVVLCSQTT